MRYALLIRLLAPLFFVFAWWRGRSEPAWREHWPQRRGWVTPARTPEPLWIHAASVGEVNSAAGLLAAISAQWPQQPLYLTAFTPTGVARLRELVPQADVSLLPLDVPAYWQRCFARIKPRALVVLETECWPHLLLACQQRSVPVLWLSARLGESSLKGMPRVFGRALLQRALSQVHAIACQGEADVQRFKALGAPASRVQAVGSLKQDLQIAPVLLQQAADWRARLGDRPVWLAASTHEGEEQIVLQAQQALRAQQPDALLLLAPRHPRRCDQVAQLIQAQGLSYCRRSDNPHAGDAAVYLIDTLGELLLFYAVCDIAFVGGSLVPVGGHNLLEPALLGKPVLCGKHLDSCRDVAQALSAAGGLQLVSDAASLGHAVLGLIEQPAQRSQMGAANQAHAESLRGAVQRSLTLLAPFLPPT